MFYYLLIWSILVCLLAFVGWLLWRPGRFYEFTSHVDTKEINHWSIFNTLLSIRDNKRNDFFTKIPKIHETLCWICSIIIITIKTSESIWKSFRLETKSVINNWKFLYQGLLIRFLLIKKKQKEKKKGFNHSKDVLTIDQFNTLRQQVWNE